VGGVSESTAYEEDSVNKDVTIENRSRSRMNPKNLTDSNDEYVGQRTFSSKILNSLLISLINIT
jgi:hypothetical protein